jgi:hypothetical protein
VLWSVSCACGLGATVCLTASVSISTANDLENDVTARSYKEKKIIVDSSKYMQANGVGCLDKHTQMIFEYF